jgi:NitT/TauT family transport system ATP-binding protein
MQSHSSYIRIRNLDKTYASPRGPVQALSGINLDIARHEFVSVLGPSGCGKSTLLKCLAALEPISSGTLEVAGKALSGPPDHMGIVFQRDVLLDWRSILDNVLITAEFRHLPRQEYEARAMQLLRLFGLEDFAHRYPWELSGGMRQRASICRALLVDPELLLMDEPFGALDAMTRDELNVELQRIWTETRKTVLFITHSIAEAVYLSDRVVVMARNPGRIAEIIDIDLPRPRPLSLRETPEFGRYTAHIRNIFTNIGVIKHD